MSDSAGVVVIGVGNDFRRDDGAGRIVARKIKDMGGSAVRVIEASGEGTALMDAWSGAECALIIDASNSGAAPGTVHRLDARAQTIPRHFFHYSTHAFSVAEAVELARALDQLPPRLILYAIEGKDFSSGEGLSPEVAGAVEGVIGRIADDFRPAGESSGNG